MNSVPANVTVCPYVLLVLSAVIASGPGLNSQATVHVVDRVIAQSRSHRPTGHDRVGRAGHRAVPRPGARQVTPVIVSPFTEPLSVNSVPANVTV